MSLLIHFIKMGGYAAYLWSAYCIVFVVLFINARQTYHRYQRAHKHDSKA